MKLGVSIVIPSWNGLDLLKRFLPSVIEAAKRYSRESLAPTEILIVDDGSSDETARWLSGEGFVFEDDAGKIDPVVSRKTSAADALAFQNSRAGFGINADRAIALRFLKNRTNLGFGETCNRGVEAAHHPLVFLLNNDVEIAPDAVAPLAEKFAAPQVFSVHSKVFEFESGKLCGTGKLGSFSHGFIRAHRSYIPVNREGGKLIEGQSSAGDSDARPMLYSMFASGGSAMFDRKKFLEIGGFEKLLSPFYWEDVEISYRAWKRGYSVLYEPRCVARHRVSSTMRSINQAKVRRIQQRNRLIFHWINLHDTGLMATHILWVILLTLTAPFRFQFGYLRAVISALKRLPEIRKRRRQERNLSKRTDRAIFDVFEALAKRRDVFAYDSYDELEQFKNEANIALAKE